jgi:hypothetical protein
LIVQIRYTNGLVEIKYILVRVLYCSLLAIMLFMVKLFLLLAEDVPNLPLLKRVRLLVLEKRLTILPPLKPVRLLVLEKGRLEVVRRQKPGQNVNHVLYKYVSYSYVFCPSIKCVLSEVVCLHGNNVRWLQWRSWCQMSGVDCMHVAGY